MPNFLRNPGSSSFLWKTFFKSAMYNLLSLLPCLPLARCCKGKEVKGQWRIQKSDVIPVCLLMRIFMRSNINFYSPWL